jgi:hypothetical protein
VTATTAPIDIVELPLMEVRMVPDDSTENNETVAYSFFAGVGFDSLMLQDYKNIQQEWTGSNKDTDSTNDNSDQQRKSSILSRRRQRRWRVLSFLPFWKDSILAGVSGYTIALFTKTLPRCLHRQAHLMKVRVTTTNADSTYWIDHRRGDLMRPVTIMATTNHDNNDQYLYPKVANTTTTTTSITTSPPTVLYQGMAGIVAAGTAPFYGGGLRLFPFARMTPRGMHLRIGRIHPLRGTVHIPQIFAGSYRDKRPTAFGCLDFVGTQFQIDILSPIEGYPLQHSGESVGKCHTVSLATNPTTTTTATRIIPPPIRFVTFLPPRLVIDDPETTTSS